jgi:hypothetical protein
MADQSDHLDANYRHARRLADLGSQRMLSMVVHARLLLGRGLLL